MKDVGSSPCKKEFERMLEESSGFYEKFVILTLGHTGMRVSEFIQLRKNWFDRYEEIINIPEKEDKR